MSFISRKKNFLLLSIGVVVIVIVSAFFVDDPQSVMPLQFAGGDIELFEEYNNQLLPPENVDEQDPEYEAFLQSLEDGTLQEELELEQEINLEDYVFVAAEESRVWLDPMAEVRSLVKEGELNELGLLKYRVGDQDVFFVNWSEEVDVTGDGVNEVLVSYRTDQMRSGCHVVGCTSTVAIFGQQGNLLYRSQSESGGIFVEQFVDLDNDGVQDILFGLPWCGASTCGSNPLVLIYTEDGFVDVTPEGQVGTWSSEFEIFDGSQDGVYELLIEQNHPGTAGGYNQPAFERYYVLDQEDLVYKLEREEQVPPSL